MNVRRCSIYTPLLLLLFSLLSSLLSAQTDSTCISWEGLSQGDQFGKSTGMQPGAVFHTEAGVPIKLLPFHYLDGSKDFRNVSVWGPDRPWDFGAGNFLFVSNINLQFDFTRLATPVKEVCLRFKDGGGQENIAVNGSPVRPVNNLKSLLALGEELAPGVQFTLVFEDDPNDFVQQGVLCLRGRIDSLLIGGQEFAIDDICFRESDEEEEGCAIRQVSTRITRCYPDGSYDLRIHMRHEAEPTDSFDLAIEGADYGRFAFNQLPLRLEKVPILTDALTFSVKACFVPRPDDDSSDDQDDDKSPCCQTATVEKLTCPPDGQCALGPLKATGLQCLDNGAYRVTLDFSYSGVGEKFILETASGIRREYSYANLPLTIESPPVVVGNFTSDVIEICNLSTEGCCLRLELQLPCAPVECRLGDLQVTNIECLPDGTYNATIDVRHAGNGEKFLLKTGGGFGGAFAYSELPKRLRGLPIPRDANGQPLAEDIIQICDATHNDCCTRAPVKIPCVPDDCTLGPVKVYNIECTNTGTVNATLDLERRGNGEKFIVKIPDTDFSASFPYSELPVRLRGLPQPAIGWKIIVQVCDAQHENCCVRTVVELPCSPGQCQIGELKIYDIECRNDGAYNATVNFRHTGNSSRFYLKTAGGFVKEFSADELPLQLTGLPIPPDTDNLPGSKDLFKVCALPFTDNCCTEAVVELPCPAICPIRDLRVEPTPCDEAGKFYLKLTLPVTTGIGNLVFVLTINGENRGMYRFGDLPLKLGPFPGPLREEWRVEVYLKEHPECRARAVVQPFECQPLPCALGDPVVSEIECLDDGTYNATINFRHRSTSGKFILRTAGGYEETYAYEQLPIRVTGLPVPQTNTGPQREDIIKVCDAENADCCAASTVWLPCNVCNLGPLVLQAQPCAEDGTFSVKLNFRHANTGAGFQLLLNGEPYGQYSYDELPLTLGPIPGEGQILHFKAVDDERPGCFTEGRMEALTCNNECQFAQLRAQPTPCEDGQFFVDLTFVPNYTGSSGFLLFADGQISGPFRYTELPRRVGPFPADGRTVYDFLLLDVSNPTCYGYVEVGPIDCRQSCRIGELALRFKECLDDGRYRYTLNFRYENPGNRFFDVYLGDDFLGYYSLADLPVNLDLKLPNLPNAEPVLKVCINDQPDCCARVRVDRPQCAEDPVHEVWPGDANTDNIANHLDLLNIGIAFGARGPARPEQSDEWEGIPTSSWNDFFANGTNYKHADTNGDGVINAQDTVAILRNYDRTHGEVQPADSLPNTDFDPPIYVDLPQSGDLPSGTVIEVPIQLGSSEAPVKDIYGLAFTIKFDPDVIDPESVEVLFPTTWFGQPGVNVITLDKSFAADGYVEVALSRTDQNEVSGYGPIALFRGIIDDIAGFTSSEVGVEQTMAMDRNEVRIQLSGQVNTLTFTRQAEDPGMIDLRRGLRVFPNPTSDRLRITNQHGLPVEWIDIIDSQGRQVGQRIIQQDDISLEGLPEGLYVLRMKIGQHIVSQRVMKFVR